MQTCWYNFLHADVNECETGISECDQNCHNNIGSYTCSCDAGFTLKSDGLHCDGNSTRCEYVIVWYCYWSFNVDNDECDNNETNICEDLCINTNGSFYCGCSTPGYTLQSNGITCQSESCVNTYYKFAYLCDNVMQYLW